MSFKAKLSIPIADRLRTKHQWLRKNYSIGLHQSHIVRNERACLIFAQIHCGAMWGMHGAAQAAMT